MAENAAVQGLDFLWLELTQKCHLNCVHCYANSSSRVPLLGQMALDDWMKIMNEAFSCGCRKVQFIGGDPTLHPGLPRLIQHAADLGYDFIEVFTNGTAFTRPFRDAAIHHRVALAFSVYSFEPSTHDAITRRNGSFVRTIESMRWALGASLKVRACITRMPLNDEMVEGTKAFLRRLGVRAIRVDRVRGVGRGSNQAGSTDPLGELCGNCWRGRLCVTASGDIYPCIMARGFQVGRTEQGLQTVANGQFILKFRQLQVAHLQGLKTDNARANHICAPDEWCGPQQICSPEEGCSPELCGPEEDSGNDDDDGDS